MNLHLDTEAFRELVTATSNELAIDGAIVEKDYYVSYVLKHLNQNVDGLVFRGGTSLSKCYQAINRFSEDIDLTLLTASGKTTGTQKKELKSAIIDSLSQMNAELHNINDIKSRTQYNLYEATYTDLSGTAGRMIVETCLGMTPYPYELRPVSNFIESYLHKENRDDLIGTYDLAPFTMKAQGMNRTFIDKVFALCDYYLDRADQGQSRHVYDLLMLDQYVPLDIGLRTLATKVREDRRISSTHRPSAEAEVGINETLTEIIQSDFFMRDYNDTTSLLLFEPVPYETAIAQIQRIIDSGCF